MVSRLEITTAALPAQVAAMRELFVEYAAALGHNLCFQGFDRELEMLPTMYGAPGGRLLLATVDEAVAGGVAVRRIDEEICEMKRLYVRSDYRRLGLGRRLAGAALVAGRELGYTRMRLDTLPTMTAALSLYRDLGFRDIEPYYENPIPGARYLEVELVGEG